MNPRGGYRIWKACPGSLKFSTGNRRDGTGNCQVCGDRLTVYANGKIVRHKRRAKVEE